MLSGATASTAIGGTTAAAVSTSQIPSETTVKQEQLSSGPQSASTTAADAPPRLTGLQGTPRTHHYSRVASTPNEAETPVGVIDITRAPAEKSSSSGARAAAALTIAATAVGGTAVADSTNAGKTGKKPAPSASLTPSKAADQAANGGSRFDAAQKGRVVGGDTDSMSTSSTAMPPPGRTHHAAGMLQSSSDTRTPEHKWLEGSRKKSGFFGKIREKLSSLAKHNE